MNYCFCLCVQKNDHDEDLDGEEGPLPGLGANKQELPMWWLFPLLCLLLQLWLLFQQQSVNNNGGSCPYLGVFFPFVYSWKPIESSKFWWCWWWPQWLLVDVLHEWWYQWWEGKREKKEERKGKGTFYGGGNGWAHFLTLPFDLCFFFTLWVSMLN